MSNIFILVVFIVGVQILLRWLVYGKDKVTHHSCPKCGLPMKERETAHGTFLGCSGYPKCKGTLPSTPDSSRLTTQSCPKCRLPMKVRESAKGTFLGCSGYPKCKGTLPWTHGKDGVIPHSCPSS